MLVNFNSNQRGVIQKSKGKEKLAKLPGSLTTWSSTFPTLCPSHFHSFNTELYQKPELRKKTFLSTYDPFHSLCHYNIY